MSDTVTTRPAPGTVERYVEMIRSAASDRNEVNSCVFTLVEYVATAEIALAPGLPVRTADDCDRLQRIRNIVTAAQLILDELAAAGQ